MPCRAKSCAAAACLAVLLPGPALAKTFCSEPVLPYCVSSETTFEDDLQLQRCGGEVADYVAQMQDFVACLGTRQEEAAAQAREVEARFRCMAEGRDDCP